MRRFIIFLSAFLLMSGMLRTQEITQQFTFTLSDVETTQTDNYDVVSLPDMDHLYGEEYAGQPQLPVKHFKMLLPKGATATDVNLTINAEQQLTGNFYLYPVQLPKYPNFEEPPAFVEPDSAIYNSDIPFPDNYVFDYNTSGFRDYNYVNVSFASFRYIPLSRQLHLFTDLTITVEYTVHSISKDHKLRPYGRIDKKAYDFIQEAVINPSKIDVFYEQALNKINQYLSTRNEIQGNRGFEPTELPALEGSPVHYVIITNNTDMYGNQVGDFTEKFQQLADWKTQSGSPAKVITVGAICNTYPGVDIAEKIREFIKDAHQRWGTEYVLLGGNASIVPVRWIKGDDKPTDLYYSAVWHPENEYEDDWNADEDNSFGDYNDTCDFTPDIAVGRAPVNTEEEVDLFLEKNFTYYRCSLSSDVPEGAWLNKQLNFSGIIHPTSWDHSPNILGLKRTWQITEEFSDDSEQYTMHEYKDNWLSTYPSWCPAYYPTDPDGCSDSGIPINDEYVEHDAVVDQLNQRYGLVNQLDHSGPFGLGLCAVTQTTTSLRASDFQNLNETNKYSVFLSGGCEVCPIDYDSYIGEQWLTAPNGGVSFLGASADIWTKYGNQYNY